MERLRDVPIGSEVCLLGSRDVPDSSLVKCRSRGENTDSSRPSLECDSSREAWRSRDATDLLEELDMLDLQELDKLDLRESCDSDRRGWSRLLTLDLLRPLLLSLDLLLLLALERLRDRLLDVSCTTYGRNRCPYTCFSFPLGNLTT